MPMKHFILNDVQPSPQTLQVIRQVAHSYRRMTLNKDKYEKAYYLPVIACC